MRTQIQSLARKLLSGRLDEAKIEKIVAFLCADSGSHDYPIHRREAKEHGLPVDKPSAALYELIKKIFGEIEMDIQSSAKLDPASVLAGAPEKDYSYTRALVESVDGGSHAFLTEGRYTSIIQPQPNAQPSLPAIQNTRTYEGWKRISK